jgi:hypothetical protein
MLDTSSKPQGLNLYIGGRRNSASSCASVIPTPQAVFELFELGYVIVEHLYSTPAFPSNSQAQPSQEIHHDA